MFSFCYLLSNLQTSFLHTYLIFHHKNLILSITHSNRPDHTLIPIEFLHQTHILNTPNLQPLSQRFPLFGFTKEIIKQQTLNLRLPYYSFPF